MGTDRTLSGVRVLSVPPLGRGTQGDKVPVVPMSRLTTSLNVGRLKVPPRIYPKTALAQ